MYKLYLDDIRPCPEGFIKVRNYEEFVCFLKVYGMPDFISFDHDLADEHYPWNDPSYKTGSLNYDSYKAKTGWHCAKYIVDNDLGLPFLGWQVHSQNDIGASNIMELLSTYQYSLENDATGFRD